jgi:hypothetical protein
MAVIITQIIGVINQVIHNCQLYRSINQLGRHDLTANSAAILHDLPSEGGS